ncbi:MAG: hypothetical protein WA268_13310 [Xanthobacteraceae bacterium]
MSDQHDPKWHWEQGNRYAVEAIKTLLLLNGGAALALLAYGGNKVKVDKIATEVARLVGNSIASFGFGALCAAVCFILAYLTQLQYGNNKWRPATIIHFSTYGALMLCMLGFLVGLYFARQAVLLQLS